MNKNHFPSNPVIESANYIHEYSKDVNVDFDAIHQAAKQIQLKFSNFSTANWKSHELNPKEMNEKTLDWIFLVDLLNFSFWSERDLEDGSNASTRFAIEYKDKKWIGYWSLCAAVNRALDDGIPITDPRFFGDSTKCTDEILYKVFKSATDEPMPLLMERIKAMREAGQHLVEFYDGKFINMIQKANCDALKLLRIIVNTFISFQDISTYHNRQVFFYKRAQILIADIWACFQGKSYGKFNNIDQLTIFADYRIPQALCMLGCMRYSSRLLDILERREMIDSGSDLEIEIRGNSIYVCMELTKEINQLNGNTDLTNVLLDFYIWDWIKNLQESNGNSKTIERVPFHRTRSVYY